MVGLVKNMHKGMINTPNCGVLIDIHSGNEYPFSRPDTDGTEIIRAWNVKVHDLVTFTLVNGRAEDVTLYKKHVEGMVYGNFKS